MENNISERTRCTDCHGSIQILPCHIIEYFEMKVLKCHICGCELNMLKVISNAIDVNFFFNDVFSFIGASLSKIKVQLKRDTGSLVKFEEHGIPKGAKILHICYSALGNLFPIEKHGNIPYRGAPSEFVSLYPYPLNDEKISENEVTMLVTWIELDAINECSTGLLAQAFDEYSQGNLQAVIIPANTAIEIVITEYAESMVGSVTSKTNAKDLFKMVSYNPTLKTIMPLISKLKQKPKMHNDIEGKLIRLANLRNKIAHTGKMTEIVQKNEIADLLASVVLGIRYIEYLRETI